MHNGNEMSAEQQKTAAQRIGARLTAARRFSAEKIRKQIKAQGRTPMAPNPVLIDPSDLLPRPKGKKGPDSKYRPEYAKFAAEMCRLGATDIEVARGLNISLSCLWRWQGLHEEFFTAFLEGKDYCDDRVERALYHRAVGYSYPDLHISSHQGVPVVVPIVKHIPPDVGAASRWLKSRRKEKWSEQTEINLKGDEAFAKVWQAIATGQVLPLLEAANPTPEPNAGGGTGDDFPDLQEEDYRD